MPRELAAEIVARNQRRADLARQEKAALADLDRAAARLDAARARRDRLIARADEEVAAMAAARDAALGVYAHLAGAERAALTLGEDVRELRRLARDHGSVPAAANGEAVEGRRSARAGRTTPPQDGSRG